MTLVEVRRSISGAVMRKATVIDDKVLNECLNDIARALLLWGVQVQLVHDMQTKVKNIVSNSDDLAAAAGHNKVQNHSGSGLWKMLDSGKPSFTPVIGIPSVVMFAGLQGSGKTTAWIKYANYHRKKGWNPAIVCADAFRYRALFDQYKQNAAKAGITYYVSGRETDPVKIAVEGVEILKQANYDLIIVVTGGRHTHEAALFEEMRQFSEATKPDLVIFVVDSSIGQAAFDQAQAFRKSISVGAVILTKMDSHAKGGGALSAVAATKSPVIFIGTGEHMDEFEVFDLQPFVHRLLGTVDSERYIHIEFVTEAGKITTIAVGKPNGNMLGYLVDTVNHEDKRIWTAYLFSKSKKSGEMETEEFDKDIFPTTDEYVALPFDGSISDLERVGGDRYQIPVGAHALKEAIRVLRAGTTGLPLARSLLVIMLMVCESIHSTTIADQINTITNQRRGGLLHH